MTESFIDEALAAAPDDMWFPKPDQLVASRVVTAYVERDSLPDSNLDGAPTVTGARAIVLRNVPILSGLAATSPALVDRIAAWYLEAYRHDWSEARIVEGLHALSDSAMMLAAAGANDAALVDLARFLAAAMAESDAEDCVAIGARGDLVTAASMNDGDEPAVAKVAALLGATMKGPRIATASPAVGPRATPIAFGGSSGGNCAALRRAYATALARRVPQAAAMLRPRFREWARRSVVTLAAAISDP